MRSTIKLILEKRGLLCVVRPVWRLVWRVICRAQAVKVFLQRERTQVRISRTIRVLRKKERVRVAFLVVFDTVFHFERLFQLMLKDAFFDPFLVVIPEVDRGDDWGERQYQTVLQLMRNKYGDKVVGYCEGGVSINIEDLCDLCVVMNSYDALTLPQYGIAHLANNGIPVIDTNYGCDAGMHYTKFFCGMGNLAYVWRFYCGTKFFYDIICRLQKNLRIHKRIRYSGVVKMDMLNDVPMLSRSRKRVIVCPHHSIEGSSMLALSNFPRFSELVQQLPVRYKDVDWIFRPHPLLKSAMMRHGGWSEDDWNRYIDRLCSNRNLEYIPNGDCYDMFVNSDAMIQDCSSFLGEYHFTGHPQCYLLKSEEHAKSQYMEWGLELLSYTYKAYSEQDIIDFIENVVIAGKDPMREGREKFAKEKLMFNYPHASEAIVADIKKALGRGASEK